jgi:hypothetical protein
MSTNFFMDKHWSIPEWHRYAKCVGVNLKVFFPDYNGGEKTFAVARSICNECPVIAECLDAQLKLESFEDQWGMFGGRTPQERKEIRNRRDRRM